MIKRYPKIFTLLFCLVGFVAYYIWSNQPDPDYGLKVLVFSKTQDFRHDSIPKGIETIKQLGHKAKFNVVASEDATIFTDKNLAGFKAVIFLNTTGDILNPTQQVAFERYIQAGGGFVGIHSATDTEWNTGTTWPWYQRLVGGVFNSHPENSDQSGELTVQDNSHLATRDLPIQWRISDEWYDFKRVSKGINVLMTVDENSYSGAKMGAGDKHPVTWYRNFDGGRSFYTALGHTESTFDDENFLTLLRGGIKYAMGDDIQLDYSKSRPEAWRFSRKVLDSNLNEPLKLTFSPTGDLYFVERRGALRRYDSLAGKAVTVHTFKDVNSSAEYGLLGLAFDPDFNNNQWLYIFRTITVGVTGQHVLSRFKFIEDKIDESSEQILLTMNADSKDGFETSHTGGDMQFDDSGNLWLSTGDDTKADNAAFIDDRPGNIYKDAARSAGNTMDLRGKILRIKPRAEADVNGRYYDIPDGNLFTSAKDGRGEIYVMGLRNPYTIAYDNRTKRIYWGEIGPDAQAPNERGPLGFDEINYAEKAGNFGWPFVIANNQPYSYFDYANDKVLDRANISAPENRSRNNTGAKILPPAQPAWIYYPYKESDEFFELGTGGRNALVAPIYYSDEADKNSDIKFPAYFDGKVIISDFIRGWMMLVNTDDEGHPETIVPVIDHGFSSPLDMAFGPDGALYVVEYGMNWFTQNMDSYISRIEYYKGDNPPPVAVITVNKSVGAAPFVTTLDASASYDRDNEDTSLLRFKWQFVVQGKAGEVIGEQVLQPLTINEPGVYYIQLNVTDGGGQTATERVRFEVGNERPDVKVKVDGNQTFYWQEHPLNYQVSVNDKEDGSTETGEISIADVSIKSGYVSGGEDFAKALAQKSVDPILAGRTLVTSGSDCHACHSVETKSIGPSFTQIAQRYSDQNDAASYLQKVTAQGGSGQWGGSHAMPPHPGLQSHELSYISDFILSLNNKTQGSTGEEGNLSGILHFNEHVNDFVDTTVDTGAYSIKLGKLNSGRYIFSASYTDKGTKTSPSLQDQQTLIFRNPLLTVSDFDEMSGVRSVAVAEGLDVVLFSGASADFPFPHFSLKNIDLTDIKRIRILAPAASAMMSGGTVELRLDTLESDTVASAEIEAELVPSVNEAFVYLDVSALAGVHDLFIGTSKTEEVGLNFIIMTLAFER